MRTPKYSDEEAKISNTYSGILQRTKGKANSIEPWTRERFVSWFLLQKKDGAYVCKYCGCKESDLKEFNRNPNTINKRKATRGDSLEVDRYDDNKAYTEDNCCLACYWCNNAKTDTFSEEDMLILGPAIGTILRKHMNK